MQKQIQLSELAGVDITAVNKEDLVDVSGLAFDNTVPREQWRRRCSAKLKIRTAFGWAIWALNWNFWIAPRPLRIASPTSYNVKRAACNQCSGRLCRPPDKVCKGSTTLFTPPINGII